MTRKLIAISGKQFSGKDTFCNFLLEFLKDFIRVGIGDAIKIEYGKQKNLTFEEIEKNKPIYRADLIALGDWGRAQNPDYWLQKIIDMKENVIVPDMRVPHEYDVFKNAGAIMLRIEAPRNMRATRGTIVSENDPTETLLDGITSWDYVIQNDSDLESLREKAKDLAEKLMNL